jgi:hypothetical protein
MGEPHVWEHLASKIHICCKNVWTARFEKWLTEPYVWKYVASKIRTCVTNMRGLHVSPYLVSKFHNCVAKLSEPYVCNGCKTSQKVSNNAIFEYYFPKIGTSGMTRHTLILFFCLSWAAKRNRECRVLLVSVGRDAKLGVFAFFGCCRRFAFPPYLRIHLSNLRPIFFLCNLQVMGFKKQQWLFLVKFFLHPEIFTQIDPTFQLRN